MAPAASAPTVSAPAGPALTISVAAIKKMFSIGSRWHCLNSLHSHLCGARTVIAFEKPDKLCWQIESSHAQPWMCLPQPDQIIELTRERLVCHFPGSTSATLTFTRL